MEQYVQQEKIITENKKKKNKEWPTNTGKLVAPQITQFATDARQQ